MQPINYLAIITRNNKLDRIEIQIEQIYDIVDSPKWRFYSFERPKPSKIVSTIFPTGIDELNFKNYLSSLNGYRLIADYIRNEIKIIHSCTLRDIAQTESLAFQLEAKLTNQIHANSQIKSGGTTIQICTYAQHANLPSSLTATKYFQEKEKATSIEYQGDKYYWFGGPNSFWDCGREFIQGTSIEGEIFEEFLSERSIDAILAFIRNHKDFAKANLISILRHTPPADEIEQWASFIEALKIENFIHPCLAIDTFKESLKAITSKLEYLIANEQNRNIFQRSIEIHKLVLKTIGANRTTFNLISERVANEECLTILSDCLPHLLDNKYATNLNRELLDKLVDLFLHQQNSEISISKSDASRLFLIYCFKVAESNLTNHNLREIMAETVDAVKIAKLLSKINTNTPLAILDATSRIIDNREYNKGIYILNQCIDLILEDKLSEDFASQYVRCLAPLSDSNFLEIAESFSKVATGLPYLNSILELHINSNQFDKAENLISRLRQVDPHSIAINELNDNLQRRRVINTLLSKECDIVEIDKLSGIDFERLLKKKFVDLGFNAEETPHTGDYGADLIIENNQGTRFIIQCKRFSSKVNLKAVQEVVAAVKHFAGDYGIVITTNSFLPSAINLAESNGIKLWDRDKLINFLNSDHHSIILKDFL